MDVCAPNINFLINNGEFHLLFNGCCIGLFANNNQCSGLDTKQDPLLNFFYKLLRPEDARNGTRNGTRSRVPIPD